MAMLKPLTQIDIRFAIYDAKVGIDNAHAGASRLTQDPPRGGFFFLVGNTNHAVRWQSIQLREGRKGIIMQNAYIRIHRIVIQWNTVVANQYWQWATTSDIYSFFDF